MRTGRACSTASRTAGIGSAQAGSRRSWARSRSRRAAVRITSSTANGWRHATPSASGARFGSEGRVVPEMLMSRCRREIWRAFRCAHADAVAPLPLHPRERTRLPGRGNDRFRVSADRFAEASRAHPALEPQASATDANRSAGTRTCRRKACPGNVLIVANHISWLDIFVLNTVEPGRFIAKAELKSWPLVGHLIAGCGTLFLNRASRRDAHASTSRRARCSPRATRSRFFRKERQPTAPRCCRSTARCCSRWSTRRATSSRSRSATVIPMERTATRRRTSATRRSWLRSGACSASASSSSS